MVHTSAEPSKRILSIQSHVVSGYCGNKSATFPLQLLGFEVDVINTVQLSNHTQYKVARGQIFSSKDLKEIHDGLQANDLLKLYDNILSGYVADVGYIEAMADMIKQIKSQRTGLGMDCFYTFDPVLGDDATSFYVPNGEKIAEAYKKNLVPLADIITPNRFEASILSGIDISNESESDAMLDAMRAIDKLHSFGVRVVVITSFEIKSQPNYLTCILSHDHASARGDATENQPDRTSLLVKIPKLDLPFTGTGDLFAALITAWLIKTNFNLKKSLECTANSIHSILEDTLDWSHKDGDNSVQSFELRLIQNKDNIMSPVNKLVAERISKGHFSENQSQSENAAH